MTPRTTSGERRAHDRLRWVIVTRPTPWEELVHTHGTEGQARFFLETRGRDVASYEAQQETFETALQVVEKSLPSDLRQVRLERKDLGQFIFAPDDVICVLGQDGLVANVAKYLNGQRVVGVNSDPDRYDGVLCPHRPDDVSAMLEAIRTGTLGDFRWEGRSMVRARRDDGLTLLALNEIFIGHESHQSAKYRLVAGGESERHSSSGLICATGTGSTGWTRSIVQQRHLDVALPHPMEARLIWLVREPFPSIATGVDLDLGFLSRGEELEIISAMGEGGVAFGDGIESDAIEFGEGASLTVGLAEQVLHTLVRR